MEDDGELRAGYWRLLADRHDVWLSSSREVGRLWQLLTQGHEVRELGGFGLIISSPWLELGPDEPCSERLIRTLRREFPGVPVVLAGRSRTVPIWVRLLSEADPGVRSLFPVDLERLAALVEELLETKIHRGGV